MGTKSSNGNPDRFQAWDRANFVRFPLSIESHFTIGYIHRISGLPPAARLVVGLLPHLSVAPASGS